MQLDMSHGGADLQIPPGDSSDQWLTYLIRRLVVESLLSPTADRWVFTTEWIMM
jgi:hypothetical protein